MPWLVGLNSLRFYAIALIVVYHLFRSFLPGGFIAVEIFFAISGFLIFAKLLREYQDTGKVAYRKFMGGRIKRLFMSLLICVVLSLALALLVNRDLLAGIQLRTGAALTFTTNILELATGGNYENTISPNPFEHTWFLALEMQFYLLMPLLAKLILATSNDKRKAIRRLGLSFLTLAILSDLLMVLYGGIFGATNRSYFAIDTHMGSFCLGAAFAALNHLVPRTPRTPKLIPSIGLGLSLIIVLILSFKTEYSDSFAFIFVLPFVGLLSIIMMFCIIKLQSNQRGRRRAPLLLRFFEYFGGLSFGIYLFHYPLYVLLSQIVSAEAFAQFLPIIVITLSVFLSWFFTAIFDLPKIIHSLRFASFSRRALRVSGLLLCLAPAAYLLITTPATSGISEQLASVETAEFAVEPDFRPDLLGGKSSLTAFSNHISPLIDSAVESGAIQPTTNHAAPSANIASVLVLGDSVTLGAKDAIESIILNSYVDAKESRGIETATGLLAGYAATGKLPDVIVISLATNERTITDSLLQNIIDVAGADHKFILVTAYAGPQQPRDAQNAALKKFASTHDNVYICDWWERAHDNWQLMYADHIHLNPDGRLAYANLLNSTIKGATK